MRVVTLRPVNSKNEQECISLAVSEDQSKFVAPNSKSIEWVRKNPRCVPLSVYADHKMVGFVMYEPRGNEVFSIHRIMIDAQHQGKGIGRRALQRIKLQRSSFKVSVSYSTKSNLMVRLSID
jgi:diamine N-acetyltransferase